MALLDGKVAIVSGAGRGIGRAEALALAKYGAKVIVNDPGGNVDGTGHDNGPAEQVVAEIRAAGGTAAANFADVSDYKAAEEMVGQAVNAWGRLDIVVNNAGILRDRIIWNMTEDDWDAVIRVHMKGTFCLTRHAVVYWRAKYKAGEAIRGRIINTASAAMFGNPGQSNYGAAKGGITSFTQVVAVEVASMGITCNVIRPGGATRMSGNVSAALAARRVERPAGEFDPSDVASTGEVVAYLASDEAQWISGQMIKASGNSVGIMKGWSMPGLRVKKDAYWMAEELVAEFPKLVGAGPLLMTERLES